MRKTTAKRAKMTHKPRPPECSDCDIPLAAGNIKARDVPEGHAKHGSHGFCERCLYRRKRNGFSLDGPPPSAPMRWKAVELVAEWELLRDERGLDRDQAAKILGVKPSTIGTAITRARQYAERNAARAELAAAETEAHRINDDMIAYAVRKGVAA